MRPRLADDLQKTWDNWHTIRERQVTSVSLPENFPELFRPDTDNVGDDDLWREKYQTVKYEIHPPLEWGDEGGFTDAYHRSGWPDWYTSYSCRLSPALTSMAGTIRI